MHKCLLLLGIASPTETVAGTLVKAVNATNVECPSQDGHHELLAHCRFVPGLNVIGCQAKSGYGVTEPESSVQLHRLHSPGKLGLYTTR